MNEIGFRIEVGKTRMIIFFDKSKRNYIADSDNRNYCTVVKIVNAEDADISFLLILKKIHVLLK